MIQRLTRTFELYRGEIVSKSVALLCDSCGAAGPRRPGDDPEAETEARSAAEREGFQVRERGYEQVALCPPCRKKKGGFW